MNLGSVVKGINFNTNHLVCAYTYGCKMYICSSAFFVKKLTIFRVSLNSENFSGAVIENYHGFGLVTWLHGTPQLRVRCYSIISVKTVHT